MRHIMLALLIGASPVAVFAQMAAKPASSATIAAQQRVASDLPAEDGRDAAFADRGFLGSLADPVVRAKDGKPVWNLDAYA